jgi:hypothetical protein
MAVTIKNIETNATSANFAPVGTNITYSSDKVNGLPGQFSIPNYRSTLFLNSVHKINTGASDTSDIISNNYEYGIAGLTRLGKTEDKRNSIGAMLFDIITDESTASKSIQELAQEDIKLPSHKKRTFWEFLSRIWNFLKNEDREVWENFWDALVMAGFSNNNKADDFISSIDPQLSNVDVFEYYFDLEVSIELSIPTNLYPELPTNTYTVRPIGVKLETPVVTDNGVVREDMIEISASDYYTMRDIAYGQYVVVIPKDDSIDKAIFYIKDMKSSEEPIDKPEFAEFNMIGSDDLDYGTGGTDDVAYGAIGITNTTDIPKANYRFLFVDGGGTDGVVSVAEEYYDDIDGVDGVVIHINRMGTDRLSVSNVVSQLNSLSIRDTFSFSERSSGDMKMPYYPAGTPFPRVKIKLEDMSHYNPREYANGRYIAPTGMYWKCYDSDSGPNCAGEYAPKESSMKYYMQVNGDLTLFNDKSFTIYITTGRSFNIDSRVIEVPNLQTSIDGAPLYFNNSDYSVYNHVLEFNKDIFKTDGIPSGSTLYSKTAPVINDSIFKLYGGLLGITDWDKFNYDNTTARSAISSLMNSLQKSSRLEEYGKALSVYYNLPNTPEESTVYGLYESYGYEVSMVNYQLKVITLIKKDGVDLSKLISYGTEMLSDRGVTITVKDIDRAAGNITLDTMPDIKIGDKVHVRLVNKMRLISAHTEVLEADGTVTPAYITVDIPNGPGPIQHVIDIYREKYSDEKFPEVVIYGTEDDGYDNVYHITSAEYVSGAGSPVKLTVYNPKDSNIIKPNHGRYIYNDFIRSNNYNITKGYAHFPWPTHKFLLLWLKASKRFHIAYIDAPLDTIYDIDDSLSKYDNICRNVSVLDSDSFPGWSQYGQFRFSNGIDSVSSIVEATSTIDGAEFGTYFPAELK